MRNLVTLLAGLARSPLPVDATVGCRFRVLPADVGLSVLRSDRYFAIAEAAQYDFLARTRLLGPLLGAGIRWVNLAQASRLERPLRLFEGFEVRTAVAGLDARHAWFSHEFFTAQGRHAQVLVKAKFKQGRVTQPPTRWLGPERQLPAGAREALDAGWGG